MSEVIRCPNCGSQGLTHRGANSSTLDMGLTQFKCNGCDRSFWYNTGNAKTVVNIEN